MGQTEKYKLPYPSEEDYLKDTPTFIKNLAETTETSMETLEDKKLDKTSKATSDEAIAGTNNTKYTTPSTVKSAIDKALEGYTPSGGGSKEIGYADETLEGTEVILIEESDFAGENSIELAKVEQTLSSNSEKTVPSVKAVNNAFESGTGYIKYVDGTMICYGEYSFSAQTLSDYYSFCKITPSINVTFPKQFKETPTITISSKMFQMFSTFVDSVNNSSFKFRGCYPSNYSSLGGVIDYIAIGRWK